MKRVLLITQNFYPEIGSAGNRMTNFYELLIKRGYDTSVLTTDPTYPNRNLYDDKHFWYKEEMNNAHHQIKRVSVKKRKYSNNFFNRLIYYLEITMKMMGYILFKKHKKYDFILVTSPPIFIGIVGILAKIRFRSKLIIDIRDLWPESLKGVGVFNHFIIIKMFEMVERMLYKSSNKIIVNSKGFIDHITDKYNILPEKIAFIPNAARHSEVALEQPAHRDFKVVYAGNIGLAQDKDILLNLAQKLKKENIPLTIISYGVRKSELRKEIKELELTNVYFKEPTTRLACLKLMAKHQVGIVTLNRKPVFQTVLPGRIIDYMTCGIPIVAALSGYAKSVIEAENVGFVSENWDVEEMFDYILKLKHNSSYYKQISNNTLEYVKKIFLWEKNIKIMENVLEELSPHQRRMINR